MNTNRHPTAFLAFLILVGGVPFANAQEAGSPGSAVLAENCLVKYINNVNIPSEVDGKLMELEVEEGMELEAGTTIAVIDGTAARLALNLRLAEEKVAQLQAANEVNLQDAKNTKKLADAEALSFRELLSQNAVPKYESMKKDLEAIRAGLRIELAEREKKIAEAQYIAKRNEREIAEFEIRRRTVTAPFAGFVEKRIAQLGEWVQPGSPIITLVQLDRVRVEGDINIIALGRNIGRGTNVTVRIQRGPGGDLEIPGQIGFVSSEVDLRKRNRIWVEIENQRDEFGGWVIKPGMQAEIEIRP
ncbi:MAG: HlyD family efflux transporter periplasmic adaptor subunit [Planctomycetota bacterium]